MPLFGTLKLMPLPDLLQWLGASARTGTLQIEHDRITKSILFQNGEVIGCSSNDPPLRLGHFLLARGKITEDQLRDALATQEQTGTHLGMILVQLRALSSEELYAHLEAKAEETIFSLFEKEEASFRFHPTLDERAHIFPVSLRVQDVLLRGLQRYDETKRIDEVFDDFSIVLRATGLPLTEEIASDGMAATVLGLVDGHRTIADVVLEAHGSEYAVTKLLFDMQQERCVEILPNATPGVSREHSPAALPIPDLPDEGTAAAAAEGDPAAVVAPQPNDAPEETGLPSFDLDTDLDLPPAKEGTESDPADDLLWELEFDSDEPQASGPAPEPVPAAPRPASPSATAAPGEDSSATGLVALENSDALALDQQLERARKLMANSEFEAALVILDDVYRKFPGDESLRRLTAEAELAFIEKALKYFLPPTKIPFPTQPLGELKTMNLSPTEFFLLSRMDGTWDIKSIVQVSPMRESDALRTLKRMRESGLIDLRDPD